MPTPEQLAALDAARALAGAGCPVFAATADAASPTGYRPPRDWQRTRPDPRAVDAWRPGMALAMVTGLGLDVVDIDPRNGGDPAALDGAMPVVYGVALTPSGGAHAYIRSLGAAKRTGALPGIDVQAGALDGTGRGFVFLPPTVRASKATGLPAPYRWAAPPDLGRLRRDGPSDASGAALLSIMRGDGRADAAQPPGAEAFMAASGPWANIEAALAGGRNNGVAKLAAALRGRGGWRVEDAIRYMSSEVWPLIDQEQGGHAFPVEEFEAVIRAAWRQYPDGSPPPGTGEPGVLDGLAPPHPARYFGEKNSLLAATLAGDAGGIGPLALGADDRMWAYRGGVWRPDPHVVRERCVFLLGERYRPGHAKTAEDIARHRSPTIASEPVERWVNFRNGLLDWRAGVLADHTPDARSTVQLAVEWDPEARCPAFERFVAEIVAPDVVETVWELVGYLMYSGNPLHKAVMLTGTGRNGKGTFLRAMVALLGRANCTAASLHDLVNTRFTTASLFGKLANIAGDIDGGHLENTAVFKAITGGDMISAEHKNRDRFDFTPWAVPAFSANKIPSSADTTIGYLSRWLVINFPNDFTGRENRGLDQLLRAPAELAGVAARGLRALPGLLERGDFAETESSRAAREEFARRVDQVRAWLDDCAEIGPGLPFAPRTELYQAYQRWAARDGHRPVRAAEFYDRLEAAGGEPAKQAGTRGFRRVKVLDQGFLGAVGAGGAAPAPTNLTGARASFAQAGAAATPAPNSAARDAGADGAALANPDACDGATQRNTNFTTADAGPNQDMSDLYLPQAPAQRIRGPEAFVGAGGAASPTLVTSSSARAREELLSMGSGCSPAPPAPKTVTPTVGADGTAPAGQKALAAPAVGAAGAAAPDRNTGDGTADARASRTAAAVAAASGPAHRLPALVTADGALSSVTPSMARAVYDGLGLAERLAVDVETTGYPIGHADYALRTIQLGDARVALVLDAGDSEQRALARELLGRARALLAHSATADLIPLAIAGVIDDLDGAWGRALDTVIPAKLADPGGRSGLKALAASALGDRARSPAADAARAALFKAGRWLTDVAATTPVERSGWARADPRCETMIRYAASDVLDTAALARALPPVPPEVMERERLAQRMTARVTHRGLRVDGQRVAELLARERAALADAADRLRALGVANPGSDQRVAARAAELGARLPATPTGRLSVAKGALSAHKRADGPLGDFVRARLDYQRAETALGLFLEPYRQLVERGDGRARPTVYTLSAATGRMSCARPNLQQVPREGGYRACVTADPGQLLISADFSGVELRVAAALSGDANLRRMLTDGVDVHGEIARLAFGPGATKADRYDAKRGVFGRIYGAGVPTIARSVDVSEATAAAVVAALDSLFPDLRAWSASTRAAVERGGVQFRAYSGRVIHLPPEHPHKAPNYCIQGTARELLIDALIRWRDTPWGESVLLPVHDELIVAVPEDEAGDALDALVAAMGTELGGLPIVAEAGEPSFAWRDSV